VVGRQSPPIRRPLAKIDALANCWGMMQDADIAGAGVVMPFAKLYAEYEARCRARDGWIRPRDDLWELLEDSPIDRARLQTAEYAVAFWALVFGDPIEGVWADGSLDWPTEMQWARFAEATCVDADEASA
jgi:hypothetical protein